MAKAAAKQETSPGTAIVEQPFMSGAVVPSYMNQGSARGSEEVGTKDMVIPRLEIVQSQSPIRDDSSDMYNPDAKEGMLFNSVTSELYGDLVYFIPVFYRTEYLVWKDQDQGGGFYGSYNTAQEAEERKREVITEDNENPEYIEVVDTPVQYGMLIDPATGVTTQIVISMAKSKAKVSRKWNSMIQIVGGDRFSRVYKITTFTDENKQGKKFKNFVVQPAGFTPELAYRKAEELYNVFKSGEARAAHETAFENGDGVVEGTNSNRGEI